MQEAQQAGRALQLSKSDAVRMMAAACCRGIISSHCAEAPPARRVSRSSSGAPRREAVGSWERRRGGVPRAWTPSWPCLGGAWCA